MSADPPVRRPQVAAPLLAGKAARRAKLPLALGLLVLGTAVFAKMVDSRSGNAASEFALPPLKATTIAAPIPQYVPAVPPVATAPFVAAPQPAARPLGASTYAMPPRAALPPRVLQRAPAAEQFGGPALLFDFYTGRTTPGAGDSARMGQAPDPGSFGSPVQPMQQVQQPRSSSGYDPAGDAISAAGPPPSAAAAAAAAGAVITGASAPQGSVNERFAERVGGGKPTEAAQAQQMGNLDRLVPQGAIVGAVMETALNSDLPGYARALVSKDVLSFDGSAVLIPAGSRVIGEYNSGVAQGASRIFIVWSRLIRPDGVSIALGSPAVDELGRGGLNGKVNRHFLQKFGGAILLSVLTGGISALTASLSRGSSVIVSTSSEATNLAGQALRGNDIPTTIKTKQGALVLIFVARDLDFTAVGPALR